MNLFMEALPDWRPWRRTWLGLSLHVSDAAKSAPAVESSRLSILAPDAERFLRRPVGDREQNRVLGGMVRITLPRRHHEDVVRPPFEHLVLDRRRTPAFGADEDRPVGRTIFLAPEALRQQREVRAHGRQDRPAVDGIGIAHA